MIQSRPSRTAQGVAMRRAAHQIVDHPRVFHDPLALTILGEDAARDLEGDPSRFNTSARLRAFVAARSRYAEDELAAAFQRGVREYVLLGAGLDTFAYRNPRTRACESLRSITRRRKLEARTDSGGWNRNPGVADFRACRF